MALYKNKYRVEQTRLRGWDYSTNAFYYITVCVERRIGLFGQVNDGVMFLSRVGQIADECWRQIPLHFPFTRLDEYVIMPDHIHGIISIERETDLQQPIIETQAKFGPQSKNIASIVRGFKIGVKKAAAAEGMEFVWQKRFYDHIVRDEDDLNRIRQYMRNNPANWHT